VRHFCWFPERTQIGINALHYAITSIGSGSPADFDMENVSKWFGDVAAPLYQSVIPEVCYYVGCEAQRVFPTLSLFEGFGYDDMWGDVDIEPLPAQVSGFIKLKTSLAGRSGLGRVYVPFPPSSFVDAAGAPTGAAVTAYQAVADGLMGANTIGDGTTTGGVEMIVWGRTGPTIATVVEAEAKGKWATQRRRGMFGSINDLPEWVPLPLDTPA